MYPIACVNDRAVFDAAIGCALLVSLTATAYPVAVVLTPPRVRVSHRLCATAVVASWWLTLLFYGLASVHAFRLPTVLGICIVAAVLVLLTLGRRTDVRQALRRDVDTATALLRRRPTPVVLLTTLAVGGVFGLRFMKGLVAPPLGWDALTYHLVKAGRWVQHGGWARDAAPDAWRYYEYFPPGGDLLWAWAMLPTHSDAYVAVATACAWLTGVLAAYGAARALHARAAAAWTTALGVAVMPCVLNFMTSAYVTGPLLTALLLALTFQLLATQSGRLGDAVLAAAALGLASGVQSLALPILLVGLATLVACRWWHIGASGVLPTTTACIAVVAPMLTGYVVAWQDTGSPIYPLSLTIAGKTVFQGSEQLAGVFSGANLGQLPVFEPWRFLSGLFYGVDPQALDHLNFGAGAIGLLALGLVSAWPFLAIPRLRPALIVLVPLAIVPVVGLLSDAMLTQRTTFAPIVGRLIAPALAAIAIAGSVVSGRAAQWCRTIAVLVGTAYAVPASVSVLEVSALATVAKFVAGAALVAAVSTALGRALAARRLVPMVGLVMAFAVVAHGVAATRADFRYRLYAETHTVGGAPYDIVPLYPALAAWRIWEGLDGEKPARIAFTAGWDGFNGHTVFRYPLMGSRLQNEVLYVPPTIDGEILDYQHVARLLPRADFQVWLGRLLDQRLDVVIVAVPGAPELDWMRANPAVFVPYLDEPQMTTKAFRLIDLEARALLRPRP